jgi:dTMP kinase
MEYIASVVGLSGSGKTTALQAVTEKLSDAEVSSEVFHDRTAHPASQKLDEALHRVELSSEARMFLILAARRHIIDELIIPSTRQNQVTLTDRYTPCTVAYQGYGEGLDIGYVQTMTDRAAHGARSSRVFLLDIPADMAIRRMQQRGEANQIFDHSALAFHERVREGYLAQAEIDERFVVIDGLASQESIRDHIEAKILADIQQ